MPSREAACIEPIASNEYRSDTVTASLVDGAAIWTVKFSAERSASLRRAERIAHRREHEQHRTQTRRQAFVRAHERARNGTECVCERGNRAVLMNIDFLMDAPRAVDSTSVSEKRRNVFLDKRFRNVRPAFACSQATVRLAVQLSLALSSALFAVEPSLCHTVILSHYHFHTASESTTLASLRYTHA